jgi:glycerol-3-phosphate dehydrogenase
MAEDVLDRCMSSDLLPRRAGGLTLALPLLGAQATRHSMADAPGEHSYGSEAAALRALPGAERWLGRDAHTGQGTLSEAMVRFAARHEMARTVEDVLARRSRLLFLDAHEAAAQAEPVAAVLAQELGARFDAAASVRDFRALAAHYASAP